MEKNKITKRIKSLKVPIASVARKVNVECLGVQESKLLLKAGELVVILEKNIEARRVVYYAGLTRGEEPVPPGRFRLRDLQAFWSPQASPLRQTIENEVGRQGTSLLFMLMQENENLLPEPEKKKPKKLVKEELAVEVSPEIEAKAEELLKDPTTFDRIIDYSGRLGLIRDLVTRKTIVVAAASAYCEYPLNLSLLEITSVGKSTLSVGMTKFFDDVWPLGALSPTALIHERGVWDPDRRCFIIDLSGKVLVWLDEPKFKTMEMLKPILSHDRYETFYKFTGEKLKTITAIIKGWPACIFCSVKSKWLEEYFSRWLTVSPEASTEKYRDVILKKGEKAAKPELFKETEEGEVIRYALRLLKENGPYKVRIPYAEELAQCFRAKQPEDMRRFDLFLALIKAVAVLHAFQREKDDKGYLIASLKDYEVAIDIFNELTRTTIYGVSARVLHFYEVLRKETGPHYYENLADYFEETYGKKVGRTTLKEQYVDQLERIGFIDVREDPEDRRRKYVVVKEVSYESLIDDAEFKRRLQKTLNEVEKAEEP